MKNLKLLILALLLSINLNAQKAIITKVIDGDTYLVKIIDTQQEIKVRLWGIDTPELNQPFGGKAKEYCSNRYLNEEVTIQQKAKDQYQRVIVIITYNDEIINEHLISKGLAWDYHYYSKSDHYAKLQNEALANRIGLWSLESPIEPRLWRKQH